MKEIKLTRGKVCIVDEEDFDELALFKWYATKSFKTFDVFYARRKSRVSEGKKKFISMHRIIAKAKYCEAVDHINGDGLDNRKSNLRICTHQQNAFNRVHTNRNNKIGITGVSLHKSSNKFQSTIAINRKQIYLGLFSVAGDADSARRFAEEKYYGEYARKII